MHTKAAFNWSKQLKITKEEHLFELVHFRKHVTRHSFKIWPSFFNVIILMFM